MQRLFTALGVLALLAFGAYAVAIGFAAPGSSYEIPKDQTLAAVLVGAIVAVVVLTLLTGGGLAFVSTFITKELTNDKPGAPSDPKADSSIAPYVPSYSYQPTQEKAEARQWLVGSAIGLVALVAIILSRVGVAQLGEWIQGVGQTQLLIGVGSIVGIAVATVAAGAAVGKRAASTAATCIIPGVTHTAMIPRITNTSKTFTPIKTVSMKVHFGMRSRGDLSLDSSMAICAEGHIGPAVAALSFSSCVR